MDTLKDVPEFFETQLDESLVARTESLGTCKKLKTPLLIVALFLKKIEHLIFSYIASKNRNSIIFVASFRELGPPDLCHITKANAKPGVKEVSRVFNIDITYVKVVYQLVL